MEVISEERTRSESERRLLLTGARTGRFLDHSRRLSSDHSVSGQSDRKGSGLRSGPEISQPSETLAL